MGGRENRMRSQAQVGEVLALLRAGQPGGSGGAAEPGDQALSAASRSSTPR
jgi:hypothetical protein